MLEGMGLFDMVPFIILGAALVAYIYLYISSRQYLKDPFTDYWFNPFAEKKVKDASGAEPPSPNVDIEVTQPERPYATSQIMGVDDYEYNMVFNNESDKELSTDLRNKLMSQYPMDWSTQPPSSSQFQQGMREMFEDAKREKVVEPDAAMNPYTAITDESLLPPDTLKMEQEERKILQTYQPKHAGDLTTYNVDDAMELIKKIYEKKGEIPQVIKKKDNVYEVIGTRKKNEKIVYEETDGDAPMSEDPVSEAGENTMAVPQAAVDKNSALDPFYESSTGNKSHSGRWSYRQWTPGLERMFAPTESKAEWY
jgi:hypothetical protein